MAPDDRSVTGSSPTDHPGAGARVCGLYAIADGAYLRPDELLPGVERALQGGASVIQYRDKHAAPEARLQRALALSYLCERYLVPLIVNDDPVLARQVGAAGVHLGRDDADLIEARAILGEDAIIGVSCYDEFDRAARATVSGADYVAFGSMYPSITKPAAVRANSDLLCRAKAELAVAVVAIGGITPENSVALIHAGADAVAVIEGVFGQTDIRAAANAYARLFPRMQESPLMQKPQ